MGEWKKGKKCGFFKDIVRVCKQVYYDYDYDEVKSNSNVKRDDLWDEVTDTDDAPPCKRRNASIISPR